MILVPSRLMGVVSVVVGSFRSVSPTCPARVMRGFRLRPEDRSGHTVVVVVIVRQDMAGVRPSLELTRF